MTYVLETPVCRSQHKIRNQQYVFFLEAFNKKDVTVEDIAQFGKKMMQKEKCHHHFFRGHSLYMNALYLTFFSLSLPYEYKNLIYLKRKITQPQGAAILALFERRIVERVPVEYITQETYYLGRKFYVNEHVLVPRSLMNTQFDDFLNRVHWQNYRVLDLCAGSGCVGITLALMNPTIKVDLVDISKEALKVAQINIDEYALADRVKIIQSDLFENVQDKYDFIISNPPYVPTREYDAQPLEVKNEPKIALEAGVDGLNIVNNIIMRSRSYLNPNGLLICEVGYTGAAILKKKYRKYPFKWFKCKSHVGKEPFIDTFIRWSGYLDSIFLCSAQGLPNLEPV